eukprot:EG_transcript_2676
MASIEEIRADLTEKQNNAYPNYQLQRWIDAKAGIKEDVLRALRKQRANERRLKAVLNDPARFKRVIHDLNRGTLALVHHRENHHVVVYVDLRQKPRVVDRDAETDGLLLFMFFLFKQLEVLEGTGHHADLVVHHTEGPMPPMADLKVELAMFSAVVGVSFPGLFDLIALCCGSNSFYRSACTALGEQAGLSPAFMSPDDLVTRYGAAHVPQALGGDLDPESLPPMGTQVHRFYQVDCLSRKVFDVDSLPGWDSEEGEEDPELDLFEDSGTPTWGSLMSLPFQLPTANAPRPPVVRYTPAAQRMWSTAMLGLAMAGLLNSPFLLAAVVLVLIHVCVSYQGLLRSGSQFCAGGEHLDRLTATVLQSQLDAIARLLEPMSLFCVPQLLQVDDKNILAFAALDREVKAQIKACVQLIQSTLAQLPPNAFIAPEHQAVYKRAEQMHHWLKTITTTKVTCIHCGKHGTMDFLDAHLRDRGDAARSKLQHAEKYSAKRRRRHSKHPEEAKAATVTKATAPDSSSSSTAPEPIPLQLQLSSANKFRNSLPNFSRTYSTTSPEAKAKGNLATPTAASSPFVPFQGLSSSTRSSRSDLKITDLGQGYDRHAKQCMACDKKFGAFRRRHWCRRCRKTICAGCAAVSLSSLKRKNPQCMCKPCALECGATADDYVYADVAGLMEEDSDN